MKKLLPIFTLLLWLPFAHANDVVKTPDGLYIRSGTFDTLFSLHKLFAENGFVSSQIALAKSYYLGNEVPINYTKAYMWASIARANGDGRGKQLLQDIGKEMDSASIIEAKKLAKQCLQSDYKDCGEE